MNHQTRSALTLVVLVVSVLGSPIGGATARLRYAPVVGGSTSNAFRVGVQTDSGATVAVRVRRDGSSESRTTAGVVTGAANTAIVEVTGLRPETRYIYEVLVNGASQGQRTTITAPPDGAVRRQRFAVYGDPNDNGRVQAYVTGQADQADLLLQVGDFPHADPCQTTKPPTIANWRGMHRKVLSDSWFGPHITSTRTVPLVQIPDDHDYCRNNAAGNVKPEWKQMALQAHAEFFPSYPLPNAAGWWHTFRRGQVCVIVLDVRTQKDVIRADGPKHSMLNQYNIPNGQLAWLQTALDGCRTFEWTLLVSPLAVNPSVEKDEGWKGFQHEWRTIRNWILDRRMGGRLLIASGDNHGGSIDDGTNSDFPELNVPDTNRSTGCSSSGCGRWSEGTIDPATNGYGLIDFYPGGRADLLIRDENGTTLKSLTVWSQ